MLEGDSAQRSEIGYPRLSVPVFETESTKSLALLTRQPAPVAYLTVKGARAEGVKGESLILPSDSRA